MSKFELFFCCVFVFLGLSNQSVFAIDLGKQNQQNDENFWYITPELNLENEVRLGYHKLRIDKQGEKSLATAFEDLADDAYQVRANSFAIESVDFVNGQYIVDVSLHRLNKTMLEENLSYYDENIIIILGDLNTKNLDKKKTFKVNKKQQDIYPYSYKIYRNKVGYEAKISIGGFLGASVTIKGEPKKLARCFSFAGTRVMPAAGIGMGGNAVGVNISTGSIFSVGLNFALFVMTILNSTGTPQQNN